MTPVPSDKCVHEHNVQRLSRHAKIILLPNDTPWQFDWYHFGVSGCFYLRDKIDKTIPCHTPEDTVTAVTAPNLGYKRSFRPITNASFKIGADECNLHV
jgi:hypothetical protein